MINYLTSLQSSSETKNAARDLADLLQRRSFDVDGISPPINIAIRHLKKQRSDLLPSGAQSQILQQYSKYCGDGVVELERRLVQRARAPENQNSFASLTKLMNSRKQLLKVKKKAREKHLHNQNSPIFLIILPIGMSI